MASIRSSGFYNNPQFAQAAANLASLFEPPSGADAAGWATANAKKAEASRIQQLFDYRNDPNFNQQNFDRGNIAVGNYAPTSSFYAQDQNNATKRRGDDITAATSRANNTDDNARALEVGRIGGLADLYKPVGEGDVRPAIPQDVAGHFGIARDLPAEQGRQKPLTEEQLKAAILGQMPQDIQQAAAFGTTPVENVVTPNGPRIATRLGAIGQEPAYAPKGNGTTMTMPDGTTVQVGGDKPITEAQGKLVNYGTTAETMLPELDRLGPELMNPGQAASEASPSIGTLKPGNYLQSENFQMARATGERFVQAILRNESGAATPDAEIAHYNATFLPVPGDQPGTVRMKSWLRKVAVESLKGGMTLQARKAAVDAAAAAGPPPDFQPGATAPAPNATVAPAARPAPTGDPRPGTVEGGYRFKGGNPSDPASWEPAQ